jgi:hypothetical protein
VWELSFCLWSVFVRPIQIDLRSAPPPGRTCLRVCVLSDSPPSLPPTLSLSPSPSLSLSRPGPGRLLLQAVQGPGPRRPKVVVHARRRGRRRRWRRRGVGGELGRGGAERGGPGQAVQVVQAPLRRQPRAAEAGGRGHPGRDGRVGQAVSGREGRAQVVVRPRSAGEREGGRERSGVGWGRGGCSGRAPPPK